MPHALKIPTPPTPLAADDVTIVGDRLLSTASVMKFLDITSDRTLRAWVATGVVPPPDLRLGRKLRWRASTWSSWLNNGGRNGATPT